MQQRLKRQPQHPSLALMCLSLAACSTHSNKQPGHLVHAATLDAELHLNAHGMDNPPDPRRIGEPRRTPEAQDPQASLADSEYPPTPRWRSLAGPMRAESNSFGLSAFYETSEFDTQDNFKTTQETRGLRALRCLDTWAFEVVLASPGITTEDAYSTNDTGAYFLGAGAATALLLSERLAIHPKASIAVGNTDTQLPGPLTGTSLDTDLTWIQSDSAVALSYLPLTDADYSLSPSLGAGYRYIDGFHDFRNGSTQEFDAQLPYGFLGMHWSQCVGQSSRWALEGMVMVGQLQGFQISFSFFF